MDAIESRLSAALRTSDAGIGDAGFSDAVMRSLPARRRRISANAGRWTLAGAAVAGGAVTAMLGAPLEALSLFAWGGSHLAFMVGAALAAAAAAMAFWVFCSE